MVKLALRKYEDSLCRCGHSSYLAHGDQGLGEYERTTFTCHACKEAASKSEDQEDDKPWRVAMIRDLHDDPKSPDEELPVHPALPLDA
jgi:CDGSH-type Zn-finger protein